MLLSKYAAQKALSVVRDYRRQIDSGKEAGFFARKLLRFRHEFWSTLSGVDVAIGATIGRDLQLPHPGGVIIHEQAVVGDDCMIMQQVTIGMIGEGQVPKIGARVYIGAGAKVLGAVMIGDDAAIGANAVVLKDVPPGCTAVGVPARILPRNASMREKSRSAAAVSRAD